jgi:hypothetical protein
MFPNSSPLPKGLGDDTFCNLCAGLAQCWACRGTARCAPTGENIHVSQKCRDVNPEGEGTGVRALSHHCTSKPSIVKPGPNAINTPYAPGCGFSHR